MPSENKPALLPCPFCGGEARVADTGDMAWVKCLNPKCPGSGATCETEVDAIAAWNTRAERKTELRFEEENRNGYRVRRGFCECGNCIRYEEWEGEGSNGAFMVVSDAPYCEWCGAKVVG